MKKKICFIYNYAQHYRSAIFSLLDSEYDIDFYFGDKYLDVRKMDYSSLRGGVREVRNINVFGTKFSYQKGVIPLVFKKYDTYIVLGDVYCLSTWIFVLLSKLRPKKRVLFWSHGWYGKENRIVSLVKYLYFNLADDVLLYGNYARKLMLGYNFNPDRLHVIYNSLDYDKHLLHRGKLSLSNIYTNHFKNTNKTLIFIGRLTPVKRLDILLNVVKNLNYRESKYNLIIIGHGEKETELKELSRTLGIDENVWFYGECYDEELLSDFIYNADVCISPGNVGLTAIHSMSYGTPVITHNRFDLQMPEFEAIEEWKSGLFFEYNNDCDLARVINAWCSLDIARCDVRRNCYTIIDSKWNPKTQLSIIKEILRRK